MMNKERRDLSLYVHIPFCKQKCGYCDFLSFGGCDAGKQREYVSALCREIGAYREIAKEYCIKTIFIGGGTPSYIDAGLTEQIVDTIYRVFTVDEEAEITIEGNPDSLTKEKLEIYRKLGINRLSIGLQSANDDILQRLGRVHNYEQFCAAYRNARQAGFTNINIDLMSGLPGEGEASYIRTLDRMVKLKPEHISAYSLIVEEKTPLSKDEELLNLLPTEEEDRRLYDRTKSLLKDSGYFRYEISNYAKPGFECRHNLVYWTGGEYLGVGLGAASYLAIRFDGRKTEEKIRSKKIRFHGVERLDEYIGRFLACSGMTNDAVMDFAYYDEAWGHSDETCRKTDEAWGNLSETREDPEGTGHGEEIYDIDKRDYLLDFIRDYYQDLYVSKTKDEMEEFMFLGLRLTGGISKKEFKDRFGTTVEKIYGQVIDKYKKREILIEDNDKLFLSDRGIDVSNVVMAEFIL